jgi:hypothetical protein
MLGLESQASQAAKVPQQNQQRTAETERRALLRIQEEERNQPRTGHEDRRALLEVAGENLGRRVTADDVLSKLSRLGAVPTSIADAIRRDIGRLQA